jgi:long-chain acyl-CoA synthetase
MQVGDITTDLAVHQLIEAELIEHGAGLRGYEIPKRFAVIADDFTVENGLLTPTLKLKRPRVLSAYQDVVQALYAEEPSRRAG